jgi:hypothetical protein
VPKYAAFALLASIEGVLGTDSLAAQVSTAPLPEVRFDAIAGRATATQLAAAVGFGSSGYGRAVLAAGGGIAWKGRESRASGRMDLLGRFYLDPFKSSPWGLYGGTGLSALYDGFEGWRGLVTASMGLEFPSTRSATWAIELGLGGGFRVSAVVRRATANRR